MGVGGWKCVGSAAWQRLAVPYPRRPRSCWLAARRSPFDRENASVDECGCDRGARDAETQLARGWVRGGELGLTCEGGCQGSGGGG